jgi:hypothetical protein
MFNINYLFFLKKKLWCFFIYKWYFNIIKYTLNNNHFFKKIIDNISNKINKEAIKIYLFYITKCVSKY